MLLRLAFIFFIASGLGFYLFANEPERWAIYYNDAEPPERFAGFNLIVFDTNSHPQLDPSKINLGYISAGEVEKWRSWYREAKERGILIQTNPNWEDSYFIDLRNPAWHSMVLDEIIPGVLSQGFNGVFLDTLDNAEYLETLDPKKYAGMQKAAIALVKEIHARYPELQVMINRGFDLFPDIAPDVNRVAAESTYTTYNFDKKDYEIVPEKQRKAYLVKLDQIRKANPKIKIYTVDYWDAEDKAGVRRIYEAQRKAGFIPYVSTVDLQDVFIEE